MQNLPTIGGLALAKGTTLCGVQPLDIDQILHNQTPIRLQGHALVYIDWHAVLQNDHFLAQRADIGYGFHARFTGVHVCF